MAGRKIDDHTSWLGAAPRGQVFPEGKKTKSYTSAEGAGSIRDYPDTTEEIEKDQKMAESKIKGHPMKTGYRY